MKRSLTIIVLVALAVSALLPAGCTRDAPRVRLGETLPALTLRDTGGGDFSLPGDLTGEVAVLLFWSEGCPYCEKGMPDLEALYRDYKERGMDMVTVQVGGEPGVSQAAASRFGLTFPVLHDPESASKRRFGIVGVPTIFLLDGRGVVVEKILGGLDRETLEEMVVARLGQTMRPGPEINTNELTEPED